MGSIHDKVIGPDMIPVLRSSADTRSVIEPQPSSFGLLLWDFQPLSSPDTLNTFMIHLPAIISQQCRDSSVTISAVLQSKASNSLSQERFIISWLYLMALYRAMLTEYFAGPAFRNKQTLLDCFDTTAATIRA